MSQPILVEVTGPKGHQPLWTVDPLIEDLLDEGLDARLAHEEFPGGGAAEVETVILWIAGHAVEGTIGIAIGYAVKYLKHMFRKYPEVRRHRTVEIRVYEGDRSRVYECVEMSPEDDEPVRHTPEDFESWTSKKPPAEGIKRFEQWGPRMTVTGQPPEEFWAAYEALVELARRISYGDDRENTVREQVASWQHKECCDSQTLAKATIAALRYEIESKIGREPWNDASSSQDADEIRDLIGDLDRGLANIEAVLEPR